MNEIDELELSELLNEEVNLAIIDELLLDSNSTEEEKDFAIECYRKTKNPWDVKKFIMLYRALNENSILEK